MNPPRTINIVDLSLDRPIYIWILMLSCMFGGWYGLENVGRLEDPPFPMKDAFVVTFYPGASAEEVELEVTERIEASLQELPQLRTLESKSMPGRSEIQVTMQDPYGAEELPQVWDELRRRVGEAAMQLPPGASTPYVEDDFADVYGLLYAVTTPGYSDAEIQRISRQISNTLKSVQGVAKVHTAGEPEEAIFVEISGSRLNRLGLPIDALFGSIATENAVTPAGSISVGDRRMRMAPELAFDSVDAVRNLKVGKPGSTEILNLSDLATVIREPVEMPSHLIRFNGEQAFTVGVSIVAGMNVVEVGKQIDQRLFALTALLPLGVELHPIYEQHVVVERAIGDFLKNLALSMLTVVGALCLFMGWRPGIVVGSVLLLTIGGTLYGMSLFEIELHRISLGALMIAMGMLVDNAIVVAEGMVVGARRGLSIRDASRAAVHRTQFPLLGATIVGILAFAGIGLSEDESGQFLNSLFMVITISLLLSWVLAITIVPLLGSYLLTSTMQAESDDKIYGGIGYSFYRMFIVKALKYPWLSTLVILGVLASCIAAFSQVRQGFFPLSGTPMFYIDYFLPQGTDILTTSRQVRELESIVAEEDGVTSVTTFVGRGPTRFLLTFHTEQPNTAYAQMTVRAADVNRIEDIIESVQSKIMTVHPDAEIQFARSEFSRSSGGKIEARLQGDNADTLRQLSTQFQQIYREQGLIEVRNNWRQRETSIRPRFDADRARIAGIGRQDLANALSFATTGLRVGLYREGDQLIPIIARAPDQERGDISILMDRTVWSPSQGQHIPMSQLVSKFEFVPEDSIIIRRNRIRSISALADPRPPESAGSAFSRVRPLIEKIDLPPGYVIEWGGEYEGSAEAQDALASKLPPTFLAMLLITILMFGRLRQALIIWLTLPMSICGVVIGLLVTDMSFTFPALLGFLSLSGMLIKNAIVLVDEIDDRIEHAGARLRSIVEACISRARPVLLAAGTTIAGMFPLLSDAFFTEMAVTIMSGLAFATLLTLVVVPVLYVLIFRGDIRRAAENQADSEAAGTSETVPVL